MHVFESMASGVKWAQRGSQNMHAHEQIDYNWIEEKDNWQVIDTIHDYIRSLGATHNTNNNNKSLFALLQIET